MNLDKLKKGEKVVGILTPELCEMVEALHKQARNFARMSGEVMLRCSVTREKPTKEEAKRLYYGERQLKILKLELWGKLNDTFEIWGDNASLREDENGAPCVAMREEREEDEADGFEGMPEPLRQLIKSMGGNVHVVRLDE